MAFGCLFLWGEKEEKEEEDPFPTLSFLPLRREGGRGRKDEDKKFFPLLARGITRRPSVPSSSLTIAKSSSFFFPLRSSFSSFWQGSGIAITSRSSPLLSSRLFLLKKAKNPPLPPPFLRGTFLRPEKVSLRSPQGRCLVFPPPSSGEGGGGWDGGRGLSGGGQKVRRGDSEPEGGRREREKKKR